MNSILGGYSSVGYRLEWLRYWFLKPILEIHRFWFTVSKQVLEFCWLLVLLLKPVFFN